MKREWCLFNGNNQFDEKDLKDLYNKKAILFLPDRLNIQGYLEILEFFNSYFKQKQVCLKPDFIDFVQSGWGYEYGDFRILDNASRVLQFGQYSIVWFLDQALEKKHIVSHAFGIDQRLLKEMKN